MNLQQQNEMPPISFSIFYLFCLLIIVYGFPDNKGGAYFNYRGISRTYIFRRWDNIGWLISSLHSNQKSGISNQPEQLQHRKTYFGTNQKTVKEPPGLLALFFEALDDFILKILLVAACVSIGLEVGFSQPEHRSLAWIQGFAILVAVFVVAFVTAINNYQKQRQFIKLNSVADEKKKVTAWRNGLPLSIHQDYVLVGDIISINQGMQIPADGLIIQSNDITTDQSAMTGEIDPVVKNILYVCEQRKRQIAQNNQINQQDKHQVPSPVVMSGTRVLTGQGKMIVIVVGPQSCIGKIRALLEQQDEQETPLQQKLQAIANDIGKFGLYSALFIVIILLIRFGITVGLSRDWQTGRDLKRILDFILIGITVIVVAIPEGLPLSVTLSLAFSVKKMLQDQNLVRKMQACETMGGANNICSDKTGTLTMNKMILTEIWNGKTIKVDTYAQELAQQSLSSNSEYVQLFKIGCLVNSTALLQPQQKGSSTQIAMLKYFSKMKVNYQLQRNKYPTKVKFPFSSSRKRMSIIVQIHGQNYLVIKGASEIVLASCQYWINGQDNRSQDITFAKRKQISQVITGMATKSLRTLCIGYKKLNSKDDFTIKDEKGIYDIEKSNMTLIAVIGVRDNPRKEVPQAIKKCNTAGITVRMVTGDNIITAKAIAKQIGLFTDQNNFLALQGPEFNKQVGGVVCKKCKVAVCDCPITAQLAKEQNKEIRVDTIGNAQQFDKIADKLLVLARSRPEDKYCLVTGLKQRGNVVAVTGDGTNDAPALKKADVGFAMGICGTQVARQAAAIILIDDNFSSIVKAVLWGRNIYDSIRKFIQFQLTVNVVAVFITLIGSALIEKEVLKPIQMLWINLIMDTLASLALATQDPNQNLLLRKPHSRTDYIISKSMMKHIIGQAVFQIIVLIILIFLGQTFIPQQQDRYDSTTFLGKPQQKWYNGVIGGTVRSGRFYTVQGHDDYSSIFKSTNIYSRHFTFIFNTFVMMQVFNFINSRKIHQQFNIFQGITKNIFFPIIVASILALQIILITFAGFAFGVYSNYGLTVKQWLISIAFGSISLVVSILLKLLPCGKQKNSQQVEPMRTDMSFTEDSYNKAIQLKIEENGEFFGVKKQQSSFC